MKQRFQGVKLSFSVNQPTVLCESVFAGVSQPALKMTYQLKFPTTDELSFSLLSKKGWQQAAD
jgi:hypothetical protein